MVPVVSPLIIKRIWCRWWDSNPHDFLWSQDFKSCASAISPHRPASNAEFSQTPRTGARDQFSQSDANPRFGE